jgi:hypothetical protein
MGMITADARCTVLSLCTCIADELATLATLSPQRRALRNELA